MVRDLEDMAIVSLNILVVIPKDILKRGSPELVPEDSAYGKTVATGFGKDVESLEGENMTGPDLAPFPRTSGVSKQVVKEREV